MRKWFFSLLVFVPLLLSASPRVQADGFPFMVDVSIRNNGEDVNAFGATMVLPDSWSVAEVELQNPELLYWITAPNGEKKNQVTFSGIFPGGITNISSASEGMMLFTMKVNGDIALEKGVTFESTKFYLNHPTALEATDTFFSYKTHSVKPTDNSFFDDHFFLNYSFATDPVTDLPALVLDSYRGNLPDYTFEKREGDFGLGEWIPVDGLQSLESSVSTVLLNIRAPDGTEQTVVLRRSWVMTASVLLGLLVSALLVVLVFRAAWLVLRVQPGDLARPHKKNHKS